MYIITTAVPSFWEEPSDSALWTFWDTAESQIKQILGKKNYKLFQIVFLGDGSSK